jgi:hypothetical protein
MKINNDDDYDDEAQNCEYTTQFIIFYFVRTVVKKADSFCGGVS